MSAVNDASILSRLDRLSTQADLCAVFLSVSDEQEGRRLTEAIHRVYGSIEVQLRFADGPPRLLRVELRRW